MRDTPAWFIEMLNRLEYAREKPKVDDLRPIYIDFLEKLSQWEKCIDKKLFEEMLNPLKKLYKLNFNGITQFYVYFHYKSLAFNAIILIQFTAKKSA
jgi:hypothetical protein